MSEKKKGDFFKKALKFLLWGLLGFVLLVVLLVAAMPLWISPVSTGLANGIVPKITGTPFNIDRFYVNPWTGAVRINGVKLSNPEGFGSAPAVSVSSVSVDIALSELFSNKLHLKDVTVVDPFASYYSHDGSNNIDVILANVKKTLGEKEEKDETPSEMKLIIDHLKVSGTKVKLMENDVVPPLPIMTIELNDIGKESDGVSFEDAWKSISDAFMKGMSSVGDGLGALGGLLGDGAKSLTSALGDGAKSLTGALGEGTKSVKDVLGGAGESTGDGAKAAAGAAVDATKNVASGAADLTKSAAGAVGDGAKATVDVVGDGAKAAAGAIGDGAKAATEGVKNLFKGFGK